MTGLKNVDDARLAVTEGDPESLGEALNGIMGMLSDADQIRKELVRKKADVTVPRPVMDHIDRDKGNDLSVLLADVFQLQVRREHDARTFVTDCQKFKDQLSNKLIAGGFAEESADGEEA